MHRLTIVLLVSTPALAHDSWISREKLTDPLTKEFCCNMNDCAEELGGVDPVAGGYLIRQTGEVVERKRVIWRSPGGWWRCRYLSGPKANQTRCLIGPPQGS